MEDHKPASLMLFSQGLFGAEETEVLDLWMFLDTLLYLFSFVTSEILFSDFSFPLFRVLEEKKKVFVYNIHTT